MLNGERHSMSAKSLLDTGPMHKPRSLIKDRMPAIGLALGGGGARGLAHTVMLEAFDELGLRPKVIAGTSIGAVIGAAYASGMSAREIRAQMQEVLSARLELLRDLFAARARTLPRVSRIFGPLNAVLSPEALLDQIYPARVARDFAQLEIPMKIVATDFYALDARVFETGSLRQAVAASMALPAIFEPIVLNERAYVDGGLVNPLPYDLVREETDFTVAIDVSGVPVQAPNRAHPTATEALFAASFIFERTIIREKLKTQPPDIYIQAGTSHFQLFDIWKVDEILAAALPAKEELKVKLKRITGAETIPIETADHPALPVPRSETATALVPAAKPRLIRRLKDLRRPRKGET
jgi:NTE family protein